MDHILMECFDTNLQHGSILMIVSLLLLFQHLVHCLLDEPTITDQCAPPNH